MIIEVRTYTIKPGRRPEYVEFFEGKVLPLMLSKGAMILGHFVSLDDDKTFVWLRAFHSLEERGSFRKAFYEGPEWLGGLEGEAMAFIADYKATLVEPTKLSAIS